MKKQSNIRMGLILAASLLATQPVQADRILGTLVGGVTNPGNDDAAGIAAILGVTQPEVTLLERINAPDISSGDLSITIATTNSDGEGTSGNWDWAGSPIANYFVVKAGNGFALYEYTDAATNSMPNMGLWSTDDLDKKGMSHVTAYNVAAIPIPAAVWLFGSAMLGLFGISRRRENR